MKKENESPAVLVGVFVRDSASADGDLTRRIRSLSSRHVSDIWLD